MKKLIYLKHLEFMTIKNNQKNLIILKHIIQKAFNEVTIDNEWDLPAKLFASMPVQLNAVKTVHSK